MMDRQKTAWFFGWLVTRKGSDTSGNYGHKGVKNAPWGKGGSAPGGGHAALDILPGDSKADIKLIVDQHREAKKRAQKTGSKVTGAQLAPGTAPNYYKTSFEIDAIASSRIVGTPMPYQTKNDVQVMAGLDSRDPVDRIVASWSSTSNDTNLRALSFQEAVSEEFKIPLSDWQKKQLVLSKKPNKDGLTPEQRGERPIGDRATERKVARAIYDRTQQDLAELGYKPGDTIMVYRGAYSSDIGKISDQVSLSQNTISSWSLKPDLADYFAKNNRPNGITIAMEVPVEAVFSTFRTGLGTGYEQELVLFGLLDNQATIVSNYGPYK